MSAIEANGAAADEVARTEEVELEFLAHPEAAETVTAMEEAHDFHMKNIGTINIVRMEDGKQSFLRYAVSKTNVAVTLPFNPAEPADFMNVIFGGQFTDSIKNDIFSAQLKKRSLSAAVALHIVQAQCLSLALAECKEHVPDKYQSTLKLQVRNMLLKKGMVAKGKNKKGKDFLNYINGFINCPVHSLSSDLKCGTDNLRSYKDLFEVMHTRNDGSLCPSFGTLVGSLDEERKKLAELKPEKYYKDGKMVKFPTVDARKANAFMRATLEKCVAETSTPFVHAKTISLSDKGLGGLTKAARAEIGALDSITGGLKALEFK